MKNRDHINMLISRLEAVEKAARGSRWRRLRRSPLRYLGAMAYAYLLYPLNKHGYRTRAGTFFGATMDVLLPAAMDIFLLGAKTHDSEIRLTRFMLTALRPGAIFVDVGAHYGFFSLLAAELVGKTGKVVAVEASSSNFGLLSVNTSALTNVEAFHLAASDSSGQVTIYEYPPWRSEANTTLPPAGNGATPTQVPAIRLDDFFEQQKVDPSFIKIDVEGAEALVAKGLSGWLQAAANPLIAMEYLPARDQRHSPHQEALARFREYDLHPHLIEPEGSLRPCPDIEAHLARERTDSENIVLKRKT